jgi:hypothetical protein
MKQILVLNYKKTQREIDSISPILLMITLSADAVLAIVVY